MWLQYLSKQAALSRSLPKHNANACRHAGRFDRLSDRSRPRAVASPSAALLPKRGTGAARRS
ncbi:MAG: hypothetical protein LBS86_07425, partial [Treponema sp.]|nr:hypothetical protein [Treponema sp.]